MPSSVESLDCKIPGAFPEPTPYSPAGLSTQQTLSQAIHARRSEFTRSKKIRIKVGTWNVASLKSTPQDIGAWFIHGKGIEESFAGLGISTGETRSDTPASERRESVEAQEARHTKRESTIPKNDVGVLPGGEEIGLYVLGLQEIVDVNSATEAIRPYTDPTVANRYKTALEYALPAGYELISERQLIGLFLLIYASPTVAPDIKSVSTTSVGTGVFGYMGNKGAVTTRVILGETTRIVFINCHLGAGADKAALDRRNWDAAQIASRTRFDPIEDVQSISQSTGEQIGDEDFAFWFGDLNYRLEGIPGDDVRRLLMLHTKNEYDLSHGTGSIIANDLEQVESSEDSSTFGDDKSTPLDTSSISSATTRNTDASLSHEENLPPNADPASLQATLSSLLPHDELHQQMKARQAFHEGWREGPIGFLPTYKYDVGSVGVFDSSDKRRGPSWCDRILYRTRHDLQEYKRKVVEEEEARRKDEEMKAKGLEDAVNDEDVLFDYNPDEDGEDDYDEFADPQPMTVMTREGFEDEILQEYYTAHQRVLSSDHKPLDSIFVLKYDAVVPELKAKVHAEVARELDRAENEGRPTITLIVDKIHGGTTSPDPDESDYWSMEGVNFGRVHFGQHKHRNVTIANTGQVPATMYFVNRPVNGGDGMEAPTPTWLSVDFDRDPDTPNPKSPKSPKNKTKKATKEPLQYTLEPGDAMNLTLTARIEAMEFIKSLNEGVVKLDDVLILRVDGGRDHFLPVSGKWVQSGLDRGIDKFMKLPEDSIRRLQRQKLEGSGSSHGSSQS